jgi:prepilin-type processing-associated H-X9-DG protein
MGGLSEARFRASPSVIPLWQDAVSWYEPTAAANIPRSQCLTATWATCHGTMVNSGYMDGHVAAQSIPVWMNSEIKGNRPWF